MTSIVNISVIIVNWNCEKYIARCIKALLAQTQTPYEIIIVDNNSSDASIEVIEKFENIKLLKLDKNYGFAKANNVGVNETSSSSGWVALLNPDAFPDPNWLSSLSEAVQKNRNYNFFGSKMISTPEESLLDGTGDIYHLSGLVWRRNFGQPIKLASEVEEEIFSPCAAAALYDKKAFTGVGGFDEDFFCYVEDVDLGFRLRLAGYNCLYVPKAIVHHMGSATSGGRYSDFSLYYGHRNLVWTYFKNMPSILLWLTLPLHLILNIASIILFSFKGKGHLLIKAKIDALKDFKNILAKRKKIQSQKYISSYKIWKLMDKRIFRINRS